MMPYRPHATWGFSRICTASQETAQMCSSTAQANPSHLKQGPK